MYNPFVGIEEALPKWAWRGVIREVVGKISVREIPFVGMNYIKRKKHVNYYASISHSDSDKRGNDILGIFSFYVELNNTDWYCVLRDLTQVIEPALARMHVYYGA